MKLKDFIKELENISQSIDNPDKVEVKMADYIPVVSPVYKDDIVFITDIEPRKRRTRKIHGKLKFRNS